VPVSGSPRRQFSPPFGVVTVAVEPSNPAIAGFAPAVARASLSRSFEPRRVTHGWPSRSRWLGFAARVPPVGPAIVRGRGRSKMVFRPGGRDR
jgi:hypothetical protein